MQGFILRQNITLFRRHLDNTEADECTRRPAQQFLLGMKRDLAGLKAETLGAQTESPKSTPTYARV